MIRQNDLLGDELLTRGEVAIMCRIAPHTLACWACAKKRKGPPMLKFGSGRSAAVRYRRSAVESWLAEQAGVEAESRAVIVKQERAKRSPKRRPRVRA